VTDRSRSVDQVPPNLCTNGSDAAGARLTDAQREDLEQAYDAYRATMAQARRGLTLTESTAEAVVGARLSLCEALVRTGWLPPGGVHAQLQRDAALLAAPPDFEQVLLGA
jgi:hypothetical protein